MSIVPLLHNYHFIIALLSYYGNCCVNFIHICRNKYLVDIIRVFKTNVSVYSNTQEVVLYLYLIELQSIISTLATFCVNVHSLIG